MPPQSIWGRKLRDINIRLPFMGGKTVNARTIVGPTFVLTMAGLFYVYSRVSVQAAKRNAERHRMADGGQINWYNESQRRHGVLKRPEGRSVLSQLFTDPKVEVPEDVKGSLHKAKTRQKLEAKKDLQRAKDST